MRGEQHVRTQSQEFSTELVAVKQQFPGMGLFAQDKKRACDQTPIEPSESAL